MTTLKGPGVQALGALVAFLGTLWVVLGTHEATWESVVAGLGLGGMATAATVYLLKPKSCRNGEKSEKVTNVVRVPGAPRGGGRARGDGSGAQGEPREPVEPS